MMGRRFPPPGGCGSVPAAGPTGSFREILAIANVEPAPEAPPPAPNAASTAAITRFYSQHGEDYLLWQFFGGEKVGFFVDVGAFDGIHLSNSYAFELQGWRGICVEAHPRFFPDCQRNRPASVCLPVACVGDESKDSITFRAEELGLLSSASDRDDLSGDVSRRYEHRGLPFGGFEEVSVRAVTLNRILEEHLPAGTEIDFLSLDVEGSEFEILAALDLARYRPRVLVVEANDAASRARLVGFLEGHGYLLARQLQINLFFARDAGDVDRLSSITVDCVIEKHLHPLGTRYTLPEFVSGKVISETVDRKIQELREQTKRLQDELRRSQAALRQRREELVLARKESRHSARKLDTRNLAFERLSARHAEQAEIWKQTRAALQQQGEQLREEVRQLRARAHRVERSGSYRLGRALTWPFRFLRDLRRR